MTNLKYLADLFEDTLCEAAEQFTGQEIYDALNEAIRKQIEWHQKELKALQDFQSLVKGYRLVDLSD
jgi:phage tail sheath protein FI